MDAGAGSGSMGRETLTHRVLGFVGEMGRRRVWRTALAYGAGIFVLLQIGEIVLPAFRAPDWALKVLVVGSLLGFPVTLALAWVFDITSDGIRITPSEEGGGSALWRPSLPRLSLLAVTMACAGGLGWWSVRDSIRENPNAGAASSNGALVTAGLPEEAPVVRTLAILPLDDFSEGEGGAYFTAGLHEELVSQISQETSASVMSRTSVVQYDRSGKAMPAIARELGVDAVLEGSVFRSGKRVRITVQLIHGATDTHLWAESYEGTVEDAISFQRKVAQSVASAIQSEIFGAGDPSAETMRIAAASPAQEEYIKGRHEQAKGTPEGLVSAIRHYTDAVEEDSSFVPAVAGLDGARFLLQVQSADPSVRLEEARRLAASSHFHLAEKSLRQVVQEVPGSEEAWEALEELMVLQGDYDGAVDVRADRIRITMEDSVALFSLRAVEERISEEGANGFWSWRLQELQERGAEGQEVSSVEMARALVGVGHLDGAVPYLERAMEEKDRRLPTLWTDPGWDALRKDPRFGEILREMRALGGPGGLPLPDLP